MGTHLRGRTVAPGRASSPAWRRAAQRAYPEQPTRPQTRARGTPEMNPRMPARSQIPAWRPEADRCRGTPGKGHRYIAILKERTSAADPEAMWWLAAAYEDGFSDANG